MGCGRPDLRVLLGVREPQASHPGALVIQLLPQHRGFGACTRQVHLEVFETIPLVGRPHVEAESTATRAVVDRAELALLHVRTEGMVLQLGRAAVRALRDRKLARLVVVGEVADLAFPFTSVGLVDAARLRFAVVT